MGPLCKTRDDVFIPAQLLIFQVEMKDVKNARFIENLISQNDMRAFVCENTADLKKFLEEVREF